METPVNKWVWHLIDASVIGLAHSHNKLPNQDAIAWFPPEKKGESFIIALSDGHGDRIHFRSKVGADLAVLTAKEIMHLFLQKSLPTIFDLSVIKDKLNNQ